MLARYFFEHQKLLLLLSSAELRDLRAGKTLSLPVRAPRLVHGIESIMIQPSPPLAYDEHLVVSEKRVAVHLKEHDLKSVWNHEGFRAFTEDESDDIFCVQILRRFCTGEDEQEQDQRKDYWGAWSQVGSPASFSTILFPNDKG